jgi:hypothetical protein
MFECLCSVCFILLSLWFERVRIEGLNFELHIMVLTSQMRKKRRRRRSHTEINLKKVDSLTKYACSFLSNYVAYNLQLHSQVHLFTSVDS